MKNVSLQGIFWALSGALSTACIQAEEPIRVELQRVDGEPIEGFSLDENWTDRSVTWSGGDVSGPSGHPLRLRVVLRDADLYSFQFVP